MTRVFVLAALVATVILSLATSALADPVCLPTWPHC